MFFSLVLGRGDRSFPSSLLLLHFYALFMMSACAQTEFLLSAYALMGLGAWALRGQPGQAEDGGLLSCSQWASVVQPAASVVCSSELVHRRGTHGMCLQRMWALLSSTRPVDNAYSTHKQDWLAAAFLCVHQEGSVDM